MSVTFRFASMLYERRMELGYTQKEAAELCGISLRHYQNLELGLANPKLTSAIYIAKEMHLCLDDLQAEGTTDALSV